MRKVIYIKEPTKWNKEMVLGLAFKVLALDSKTQQLPAADTVEREITNIVLGGTHATQILPEYVSEFATLCVSHKDNDSHQIYYYYSPGKRTIISKTAITALESTLDMKELIPLLIDSGYTIHVAENMDEAMDWLMEPRESKLCG